MSNAADVVRYQNRRLWCQSVNCFSETLAILHFANNAVVSKQKDGGKDSAYPFVIVIEVAV